MFFHFLRLMLFATVMIDVLAKKIKNKIGTISALSAGIALLSANLVWFEYRRFLIPLAERTRGRISDIAIAIFFNAIGTALTFVSLAVILKHGGRIVFGSGEKNAYFATLERLRGALPVMLKKMTCIVSNFTLVLWTERNSFFAKKRPNCCVYSDGSSIVLTYSRILI